MALVDLLPLLGAALLVLVCYGMLVGYKFSLGALLLVIANALNSVKIPVIGRPFGFLASGIESFDSFVRAQLAAGIQAGEWAWTKVLHAHAVLWNDLSGALGDLAEATERGLSHLPRALVQTIIPAWVYPLRTTVHYLQRIVARIEGELAKSAKVVTRVVVHDLPRITINIPKEATTAVKKATAAVPAEITRTLPRIRSLERGLHGIDETLKDALKRLSRPAIAAAVVGALAALGVSWMRCSRVKKAGKAICGIDDSLLDSLLVDALVLASTISVVEFAHSCQAFTSEATSALDLFVRELRDIAPVPGVAGGAALDRYIAGSY